MTRGPGWDEQKWKGGRECVRLDAITAPRNDYSDMHWLWRKQAEYSVESAPASSLTVWQLFREAVIQRSLSNCVTLVCSSFTGCSKGLCGMCWIYQSHTQQRLLFYSPQPCWAIPIRLLMFAGGWMFMLFSSYCPLVTAAGTVWFCCQQKKDDEQQAEKKNNCRVLFSGSEEVVLLPSWGRGQRRRTTEGSPGKDARRLRARMCI